MVIVGLEAGKGEEEEDEDDEEEDEEDAEAVVEPDPATLSLLVRVIREPDDTITPIFVKVTPL